VIRAVAFGAVVLAGAAIGHATDAGMAPSRAVVVVAVAQRADELATGFVVAPGRAVTAAHAVAGRGAVVVRGADGAARRATVLRRDAGLDLAVLAVDAGPRPRRPRGQSLSPWRLSSLVARGTVPAGAPAGLVARARRGLATVLVLRDGRAVGVPANVASRAVARVRGADGRVLARRPVLELRAGVRAGDSGAPVLDARGRLLGVIFARSHDREDRAWAVDARALAQLLR
jgi:S1-C subfamily serine protease